MFLFIFLDSEKVQESLKRAYRGIPEFSVLRKKEGRGERRSYFSIMIFSLPKGRGAGIVFFLDLAILASWI
jgi:hypothetical protein